MLLYTYHILKIESNSVIRTVLVSQDPIRTAGHTCVVLQRPATQPEISLSAIDDVATARTTQMWMPGNRKTEAPTSQKS